MKCGECFQWYNDDGGVLGVCLFDQVERHQNCECEHPGYFEPEMLKEKPDPYIPPGCAGCKNIAYRIPYASMFPCADCRRAHPNDYYEPIK